jgi:hypothetical protein
MDLAIQYVNAIITEALAIDEKEVDMHHKFVWDISFQN